MRSAIPEGVLQQREWTNETAERLKLGWDGQRVLIPIHDQTGHLLGHLHYSPHGGTPKMIAPAGAPRELFPPPEMIADDEPRVAIGHQRVLPLVEGEPDCITMWSKSWPAVAVPGAGSWQAEWAVRFTGRHWIIAICFDCDEAGRAGAHRVANDLVTAGLDVRIIDLDPARTDGYDLTDLFHE